MSMSYAFLSCDAAHRIDYDRCVPVHIDVQLVHSPATIMPIDPFPTHAGGECIFVGRTRIETHATHGELVKLSYEAYEPLARQALTALAQRAIDQFGCLAVRIHHALGEVPPGEASVIVQVACGHRPQAFDACRMLIDRLKVEVPVWKKEVWADGTTWSQGSPLQPNTEPGS